MMMVIVVVLFACVCVYADNVGKKIDDEWEGDGRTEKYAVVLIRRVLILCKLVLGLWLIVFDKL